MDFKTLIIIKNIAIAIVEDRYYNTTVTGMEKVTIGKPSDKGIFQGIIGEHKIEGAMYIVTVRYANGSASYISHQTL